MKRLETCILIILLTLIVPLSIFGQEYVSVIEGDIASLRLYEPNGKPIAIEAIDINNLQLGTILVSGDKPILLETSRGDMKLSPDSILILDDVRATSTSLLLIDGSVTAKTTQGALSIITPATLYELDRAGKCASLTQKEERVIV